MARWKAICRWIRLQKGQGIESQGRAGLFALQKILAIEGVALRMKLDAQNVSKQGMFDRFDDFSVLRSGGHAQIGAQLADCLVVGRGHERLVGLLENPILRTKSAVLAQTDAMEGIRQLRVVRE